MSRRIALLSKYPPLEGGIAAKTYWIARGLAARGHDVHVITDATNAGGEYRIAEAETDPHRLPNLHIHRPEMQIPWHLPEDNERALALLDLTVRVIRENDIEVLDTGYLVPYGIVGHLTKLQTGVPHVMRHGGSDLEKFLKQGVLGTLLDDAIAGADVVITDERNRSLLEPKASRVVVQPPYVPDETSFRPRGDGEHKRRLAVIGKINYHWEHKGLGVIAEIMQGLTGEFECQIVGQGKGISRFREGLPSDVVSSLMWRPFVPPWGMPDLLRDLDAVFIFESGLPHPVFSNLALEAMCSGVGIISDQADFADTYRDIVDLSENGVVVVSPSDVRGAAKGIGRWVQERATTEHATHHQVSYPDYLGASEATYDRVLSLGWS